MAQTIKRGLLAFLTAVLLFDSNSAITDTDGLVDTHIIPHSAAQRRHDTKVESAKAYCVNQSHGGGRILLAGDPPPGCNWNSIKVCLDQATEFWGRRIDWSQVLVRFGIPSPFFNAMVPINSSTIHVSTLKILGHPQHCGQGCYLLMHELAHVWGNQKSTSTSSIQAFPNQIANLISTDWKRDYFQPHQESTVSRLIDFYDQGHSAFELGAELQADLIAEYWRYVVSQNPSCTGERWDNFLYFDWRESHPKAKAVLELFAKEILNQ